MSKHDAPRNTAGAIKTMTARGQYSQTRIRRTTVIGALPSRFRGLTVIELLVVIGIIGVLVALLVLAVQYARAGAARAHCQNNLRQIGLALHQHHESHGALPSGCSYEGGADPYPHMSWCARLLPVLEQEAMWLETQEAYAVEPFFLHNPPHVGLGRVVPVFLCPQDGRRFGGFHNFPIAVTGYLGVGGIHQDSRDGLMYFDSHVRFTEIQDGTSHTLMVGERPPSANGDLGWWYAGWGQDKNGSGDSVLGVSELCRYDRTPDCPAGPYQFGPGRIQNQCDAFHFWSLHAGGAHFLNADASVRFLPYSAASVLPALATRSGGEAIQSP